MLEFNQDIKCMRYRDTMKAMVLCGILFALKEFKLGVLISKLS